MDLRDADKRLKYDSRMLEFNLKTGKITRDEYEKHLKALPDSAAQCTPIDFEGELTNGVDEDGGDLYQ